MNRGLTSVVAISASLLLAVGVVSAAVPDGSGVIHGCFSANGAKAKGGAPLYVVDSASAICSNGQAALNWNQTGPQGPQGIQGPPGPAGASSAYVTSSGLNPIPLPAGGAAVLVTSLDLPDGTYVLNATVEVYNSSFDDETYVSCTLRHGLPLGGPAIDFAETRLPVWNPAVGIGSAKLALAGTVDTTGDQPDYVVDVVCGSAIGAGAQFSQLTAIQVTSLTVQ